jgi:acyl carrier protein
MAKYNENDIRINLQNFISETFLFGDKSKLADGDSFMQKGIIDSTGVLELANFVESEYNFSIADNEMIPDNLDSIANLSKFIIHKTG